MGIFDKHVHVSHGTQHHSHNTSIVEKKAPTDDSVRLLREMEQKAEDNFLKRVDVADNSFEYCYLEKAASIECRGQIVVYVFKLNGEEFNGRFTIDTLLEPNKEELFLKIYEKLGKEIARKLFESSKIMEAEFNK